MSETATPTCPRHPDVETRLRCSACDELICPQCGREAAVGFKCPDCASHDGATVAGRSEGGRRFAGLGTTSTRRPPPPPPLASGERLPVSIAVKATAAGLGAAALGGLLLGPVLLQGTLFLISSGVIGWLIARAVYWATQERSSPFVRALALTCAGFTVAVALASTPLPTAPDGVLFLAYPAAVYGGWIVVRQR